MDSSQDFLSQAYTSHKNKGNLDWVSNNKRRTRDGEGWRGRKSNEKKKTVNKNEKKEFKFSWPEFIIYEGREVYCCGKYPSYAEYMLPGAYMNKIIYLSRQQWLTHLEKTEP